MDSLSPFGKRETDSPQPVDIVTRLNQTRADMLGTDDEDHYWDCHEAVHEIERLREAIRLLAEQDATLSVCDGNVTVTMDATLTDAEREAIERAIDCFDGIEDVSANAGERDESARCSLRGLLERTKCS
jgi:hypothetical protein